jgi:hypothetical protein
LGNQLCHPEPTVLDEFGNGLPERSLAEERMPVAHQQADEYCTDNPSAHRAELYRRVGVAERLLGLGQDVIRILSTTNAAITFLWDRQTSLSSTRVRLRNSIQ